MTKQDPRPGSQSSSTFLALAFTAAVSLAITGCANTKDQYAASADAQQRAAAEASADTKAGMAIDSKGTYLKLVDQMQKEGLWFASLAHIDALEQRWGVSPESTRMRADALRQTGQAALSADAYKRLMGTALESAGFRGLGLLAGARGNYTEAAQLLRQAQRQTPTDALLLSDLGYASLRAGQIEEARLPLMQALQLQPDSAQAQSNLALYFEVTGQGNEANSLMESSRLTAAARTAVRDAAEQLRAGRGNAPTEDRVSSATVLRASPLQNRISAEHEDVSGSPLMLKASRWSSTGGVRTAGQLNRSTVDPTLPLSTSMPARGTP